LKYSSSRIVARSGFWLSNFTDDMTDKCDDDDDNV